MFTGMQLCVMFVVSEFIIYALLSKIADTIRDCIMAKRYGDSVVKYCEHDVRAMKELGRQLEKYKMDEEEKKDGN